MRLFARFFLGTLVASALLAVAPRGTPQEFSLTLSGDSIITQRLSVYQRDGRFMAAVNAVREGDAAFTNLEILFHNYEPPPAAQSGGTWLRAEPSLFRELQWIGFNLFATANNHSLDYGIEGLRSNLRVLREAGAAYAGIGESLGEARAPGFLETARGRVALVSCASTFTPGSPAGAQRGDLRGRPGVNPLRFRTRYRVDAVALAAVRKMKEELKLGADPVLWSGEVDSATRVHVFGQTFELSDQPGVATEPDPRDLKGLADAIRDARRQADYVVVSIHAHEGMPGAREIPARFLVEFAHAAVDTGADVFIGHGPHLLRGIEIYKGKAIFYSL